MILTYQSYETLHLSNVSSVDLYLVDTKKYTLKDIKYLSVYVNENLPVFERIFKACPNIEYVNLGCHYKNDFTGLELPFHLLPKLCRLNINTSNLTFPFSCITEYPQIVELGLGAEEGSVSLNHVIDNIHLLKNLRYFTIPKLNDTRLLEKLSLLESLETLDFSNYTTLPKPVKEILEMLKDVPKLQKLISFYPQKKEIPSETWLGLDRYDDVELISPIFKDYTSLPLFFSEFKHVSLYSYRKAGYSRVNTFREKYGDKPLTDKHRELLFLCHIESWSRVRERTKNYLTENKDNIPAGINGYDKLNAFNKTTLKSKLKNSPFYLTEEDTADTIWMLHAKTPPEIVEKVIFNDRKFITEEQLLDYLNILEKPYLLESDNEQMSESIIQLFCSDDEANLKMAFQMIEGGGATVAVQSMLAAISIEHSSAEIRKAARQLYAKVGNPAFKPFLGKSAYKDSFLTHTVSKHEAISRTDFLVMLAQYHYMRWQKRRNDYIMALLWKRLDITMLSENIKLFTSISKVELSQNKNLDIKQAVSVLSQLPKLEILFLDGCYGVIPETITQLKTLKKLNISSNTMEDFAVLGELTGLEELWMMNCKVKNWDFLKKLPNLKKVHVSKADESKLPDLNK
jgi:hypothetical protein